MAIHNIFVDANALRTSHQKVKQSLSARCLALATLLFFSGACSALDTSSELEVRESLRVGVKILWDAQNYKALDAMAGDYMSKRARTPSGLWKYGLVGASLKTQLNPNVDDAAWDDFMEKRVRLWPRMAPQSPFAHMLVAEALASRAWRKRGGGYANQVRPENWVVFHQYIEEARLYLESTKKVSSRDMSWYTLMAQIAVWQSWPEHKLEALVNEAMVRDRDFFPVYFAALDYYSPTWGGDAKKIEAFAARLATQLQEPRGDAYYARVYWWAVDNHFNGRLGESKVNCTRLQRGMQSVAAEFPGSLEYQQVCTLCGGMW